MSENPFKENIEKSKKVLKEHFERRKQERKRDLFTPRYATLELHIGDNWALDDEDWDKPMKKKPFYKKIIDNIILSYYDFLLVLWRIKRKIKRK